MDGFLFDFLPHKWFTALQGLGALQVFLGARSMLRRNTCGGPGQEGLNMLFDGKNEQLSWSEDVC